MKKYLTLTAIKNRSLLFILPLYFNCGIGFAQAPDTLWTRTIGGEFNDEAVAVVETIDSGLVFAGYSEVDSIYIVQKVMMGKTNSQGETEWIEYYDNFDPNWQSANAMRKTFDGGFIVTIKTAFLVEANQGQSGSSNTPGLGYVMRTDSQGNIYWIYEYGVLDNNLFSDVCQTPDGGFVIVGTTSDWQGSISDILAFKVNQFGLGVFSKIYDTGFFEGASAVEGTSDGGFIIAGNIFLNGCILRCNMMGDTLWTKTFVNGETNSFSDIQKCKQGGYILVGPYRQTAITDYDPQIVRINEDGDTLWTRIYVGIEPEIPYSIAETFDGGYVIAGSAYSGGDTDAWICKTDSLGNILWSKQLGGPSQDLAYSVKQTFDGGYVAAGITNSFGHGEQDAWLIKLAPDPVGVVEITPGIQSQVDLSSNYPNPFNASTIIEYTLPKTTHVTLKIYNLLGQEIKTLINTQQLPGEHTITWNGTDNLGQQVSSGIYIYQINAGDYIESRKMLLLR